MRRVLVIAALFLVGCAKLPRPTTARIIVEDGTLTFEQADGFAAEPAAIETTEETIELPIPAGSVVTLPAAPAIDLSRRDATAESLAWSITVASDTTLRAARRSVAIAGPKSFPPPAGPSAKEKAAARAAWLWRVGLFAGLVLAGLGIWWKGPLVIAGGLSVAGASAFGWFVEETQWVLWIFGGGVGLAAFGFAVWHLWLKKRQGTIAK